MKRRAFSSTLMAVAGVAALGRPAAARAQGAPVEGTHYVRLARPLPAHAEPGKIEVIEFFWYGCPHCNAFEPTLEAWLRQQPDDVAFQRVPVNFRDGAFIAHQRIFYALEALGQLPAMHRKVFAAIHGDRQRLDQSGEIAAFMAAHNVDAARFLEAFNSFGTQARIRQANVLVVGYRIDGVPAIGVQGRFYTSGSLAGDNVRALAVADLLIQRVRKHTS